MGTVPSRMLRVAGTRHGGVLVVWAIANPPSGIVTTRGSLRRSAEVGEGSPSISETLARTRRELL